VKIEKVVVRTHRFASDLNEKAPKTASAAKTSLPYCVAAALYRRRVSLEEFSPETLMDERIQALARKVDVQLDPDLDKIHLAHEDLRPSTVEIHLQGGKVLAGRKEVARGWAVNPMSDKEIEEKFRGLAQTALSEKKATRVMELVRGMENLPDITPFVKELAQF
jgi:2-methylcitrate dehydratase PrpD